MDNLLIDNPYYRVLATLIAELGAMDVDVEEIKSRALNRMEIGLPHTSWAGRSTEVDSQILEDMIKAFQHMLTT
ncbi:hypothetical protein VT47_20170 [Pseudomonas syringae pv. syringae]|uniref:hypothetical protein n=1 Tax=Pseudomonas syringae TaxID=317 RepID=UPI0007AEC672|nr:hypothetical protein [Pseudomonas syringae]KZL37548.1 hypothetical protein VT47_20170 [Pseudomonas syringae pv. syringae]